MVKSQNEGKKTELAGLWVFFVSNNSIWPVAELQAVLFFTTLLAPIHNNHTEIFEPTLM